MRDFKEIIDFLKENTCFLKEFLGSQEDIIERLLDVIGFNLLPEPFAYLLEQSLVSSRISLIASLSSIGEYHQLFGDVDVINPIHSKVVDLDNSYLLEEDRCVHPDLA